MDEVSRFHVRVAHDVRCAIDRSGRDAHSCEPLCGLASTEIPRPGFDARANDRLEMCRPTAAGRDGPDDRRRSGGLSLRDGARFEIYLDESLTILNVEEDD